MGGGVVSAGGLMRRRLTAMTVSGGAPTPTRSRPHGACRRDRCASCQHTSHAQVSSPCDRAGTTDSTIAATSCQIHAAYLPLPSAP